MAYSQMPNERETKLPPMAYSQMLTGKERVPIYDVLQMPATTAGYRMELGAKSAVQLPAWVSGTQRLGSSLPPPSSKLELQ